MLKSELIPREFLLEVVEDIRGKIIRLGGPILFLVEMWHSTMLVSLYNWHEHVELELYTCVDIEDGYLGAEHCGSVDCDAEIFDHGDTDDLPSELDTTDELEIVDSKECWHSALALRTRRSSPEALSLIGSDAPHLRLAQPLQHHFGAWNSCAANSTVGRRVIVLVIPELLVVCLDGLIASVVERMLSQIVTIIPITTMSISALLKTQTSTYHSQPSV
ncbi:uncharacterized protein M421DRAFT_94105 [Didymella exigua CBS 183.55]|uniref:Uncharacterized protein n=1 Tax=Didymella exigua CBS 183.55 TaxID=1150837 RepID=A0A6A5RFL0_9PLEO|nr:uncharacterized protein M421DRAFT_94105 [Didymella exigua CBS 183.55]KAF1926253.1 hypothetical protein M421DRAFT_94105 [Didymella exigua CBS 183.55]